MKTRFLIAAMLTTLSLVSQTPPNPPTGFKPAQPCVVPWDKEK